jgi:hypothetical protein
MRYAITVMLAFMLAGCAPALVRYRVVEGNAPEADAICSRLFRVQTDAKVADEPRRRWPPLASWLRRAGLPVTRDQHPESVTIDFYSRPEMGCTHCKWPPDDRWNAILSTSGDASRFLHVEGANRPGADPGRAFVDALLELRARARCSAG